MVPMLMANAPAGHIAMMYGLTGPNLCTISACASSNHAVGEGMRMIRDGYLDLCVVGGAESATMPLTVAAFAQMTALTQNPDPESASRPFDAERDGFVMSEGGCALILESEEHAADRGARVYAEVAGYGASADAFHITAPDPKGSGAALSMRRALEDAVEEPRRSTTSTPTAPPHRSTTRPRPSRSRPPRRGDRPPRRGVLDEVHDGHMLGAAGAVEAAACALAIDRGVVPPTIHYRTPDPDCDLDYTPNEAREMRVRLALSNSFGFGGQNATVAFRRA